VGVFSFELTFSQLYFFIMPICALDVLPIIALLEVVKPLLLPGRNEISTVLQLSEASSQQQCCSQLDYIVPALYLFTPIEAVEH
jgi:hypothetical protein